MAHDLCVALALGGQTDDAADLLAECVEVHLHPALTPGGMADELPGGAPERPLQPVLMEIDGRLAE